METGSPEHHHKPKTLQTLRNEFNSSYIVIPDNKDYAPENKRILKDNNVRRSIREIMGVSSDELKNTLDSHNEVDHRSLLIDWFVTAKYLLGKAGFVDQDFPTSYALETSKTALGYVPKDKTRLIARLLYRPWHQKLREPLPSGESMLDMFKERKLDELIAMYDQDAKGHK